MSYVKSYMYVLCPIYTSAEVLYIYVLCKVLDTGNGGLKGRGTRRVEGLVMGSHPCSAEHKRRR